MHQIHQFVNLRYLSKLISSYMSRIHTYNYLENWSTLSCNCMIYILIKTNSRHFHSTKLISFNNQNVFGLNKSCFLSKCIKCGVELCDRWSHKKSLVLADLVFLLRKTNKSNIFIFEIMVSFVLRNFVHFIWLKYTFQFISYTIPKRKR